MIGMSSHADILSLLSPCDRSLVDDFIDRVVISHIQACAAASSVAELNHRHGYRTDLHIEDELRESIEVSSADEDFRNVCNVGARYGIPLMPWLDAVFGPVEQLHREQRETEIDHLRELYAA